jgi:hypothetical protein
MTLLRRLPPLFCLLLCFCSPVLITAALSAGTSLTPTTCHYLETRGQKSRQFIWTLEKGEAWALTAVDRRETHRTWLDENLHTQRWQLERAGDQTSVYAWRNGRNLHIEGTVEGRQLERTVTLDDKPWYQALSLSLRSQLGSAETNQEFWVLRPDTMEPVLLKVVRLENEVLDFGTGSMETFRVEIRPAGWKSAFWKGVYWFRRTDCSFVRYEGDSGPPGFPSTIITLIELGGS